MKDHNHPKSIVDLIKTLATAAAENGRFEDILTEILSHEEMATMYKINAAEEPIIVLSDGETWDEQACLLLCDKKEKEYIIDGDNCMERVGIYDDRWIRIL